MYDYEAQAPLSEQEEADLIVRVRAGDRGAESRMVASVVPLVRGLAGRACRLGVEVDDLQQAGMIAVWRALRSFDPTRGRWCGWARRHARFDILHAAQDGAPTGSPLIDTPAPEDNTEDANDREQAAAAVRAGLHALLGKEDAEVVACKVLEDMTETQTARQLRRSWRTVRASEQRGLSKLRAVMSRATA